MRLTVRHVHYFVMIFLVLAFAFFQSYVLGVASWSVFHIDFLTIFIVYMAVEHPLGDAFVRSLVAALVVTTLSLAPSGFFVMYYVQILVIAAFVSKRFVLWGRLSQFGLFAGLLALKYILFAVLVVTQGGSLMMLKYFLSVLPSAAFTCFVALPMFRIFSALDSFFEARRGRDETGYSLI